MKNKMKKILASTNQNFYSLEIANKELNEISHSKLCLADLKKEKYKNIILSSFSRKNSNDENDKLIYEIVKSDRKYYLKTGLFVGDIFVDGIKIQIRPNFTNGLFRRMLSFADNIFIDSRKSLDFSRLARNSEFFLFEYMFLTSLQKAAKMGFPQKYKKQKYHDLKIHGSLNISALIKKDIPFKGRLSSIKNERKYDQEIIDVLYYALFLVRKDLLKLQFSNLGFVKSELKNYYSGKKPSALTINRAKNSFALNNPLYMDFKRALLFAEIIIKKNDFEDSTLCSKEISGYLIDISELWESYLAGVLRTSCLENGWNIYTQEKINLYQNTFFKRNNYPDIVLKKIDNEKIDVIVIDAKFKKMEFKNKDIDRTDLFQIHSYAFYYNQLPNHFVRSCCLIYPLKKGFELNENSDSIFGLNNTKDKINFFVDGVYDAENTAELENNEESFIKRFWENIGFVKESAQ